MQTHKFVCFAYIQQDIQFCTLFWNLWKVAWHVATFMCMCIYVCMCIGNCRSLTKFHCRQFRLSLYCMWFLWQTHKCWQILWLSPGLSKQILLSTWAIHKKPKSKVSKLLLSYTCWHEQIMKICFYVSA